MSTKRNDFKVYEEVTTTGKTLWRVKTGGKQGDVITSCNTKELATETARQLNIDPWFLGRGDTRKDRIAAYDKQS